MKSLRVYSTRIEIYPYELGEYDKLERWCSTDYNKSTHSFDPIGCYYDEEEHTLIIPRGINIDSLHQMTGAFPTYYDNYNYEIMKEKYKVLRKPKNEEQVRALYSMLQKDQPVFFRQMVLEAYPGFGKTYCAIVCALELGLRTIIITPFTAVHEQWIESITAYTTVDPKRILDLCSFNGTKAIHDILKKEIKCDVVLILQQTVNAYLKAYGYRGLKELFDHLRCGTKIIDEVHLFFKTTIMIDFSSNIKNNFYLSGTCSRSNPLEVRLFKRYFSAARKYGKEIEIQKHIIYNFIYYDSNPSQIDQGSIMTAHGTSNYNFINYALKQDPNKMYISAFFHALESAKEHAGRILAIFPKIETCDLFAAMIKNQYPDEKVGIIYSKNTLEENKNSKKNATIIISTFNSIGTGGDIDGLQSMIIGDLFSSEITSKQFPNRLRKLSNGEDCYCYELVDTGFESIMAMVRRKRKYLDQFSKKINILYY